MKKTLKFFGKCALVFAVLATASSCSSDDGPSGTKVRYSLYTSGDIISSISFRNDENTMTPVGLERVSTEWARTEYVDRPFDALVTASFNNQTQTQQTFTLSISVDGQSVETFTGTVSPGVTSTHSISEAIAD